MSFGPRAVGDRHGHGRAALRRARRAALGVVLGAGLLGVTALPAAAFPTATEVTSAPVFGAASAGLPSLSAPAPDGGAEWSPAHGQTCDTVTFSHQRFWLLPEAELAKDPADRDWSTAVEPESATVVVALGGTRTVRLPYTFGEAITVPVPDPTVTTPYTISLTVSFPDGAPVVGEHELGSVEGTFEPCDDAAADSTGSPSGADAGDDDAVAVPGEVTGGDAGATDDGVLTEVLGDRVVAGDDTASVDAGGWKPGPMLFVMLGLAAAGLGVMVLRHRPTEG